MDTQVCKRCGVVKPLTAFATHVAFGHPAGHQKTCNACAVARRNAGYVEKVAKPAAAARAAKQAAKSPGRVASGKAHNHPNPEFGTVYVRNQPKKLPARGQSLADVLAAVVQPELEAILTQAKVQALGGDREMLKILVKLYADHEPQAPGELADIYYELARRREERLSRARARLGGPGVPLAAAANDAGAGLADAELPDPLVAGGGAVSPGAG